MNNTYGFLNREEWAARERTPSDYDWDNLRTSTDLSLYANVAEIAAATEALHSLYQDEGRAMRAAKQAAASAFARHPGDTVSAWNARFQSATPSEQAWLRAIEKHRRDRKDIADALAEIRNGVIPQMARYLRTSAAMVPAAAAILAEIGARYDVAHDADVENMRRLDWIYGLRMDELRKLLAYTLGIYPLPKCGQTPLAARRAMFSADLMTRWDAYKKAFNMSDPRDWEDESAVLFNWDVEERKAWVMMFGNLQGYRDAFIPVGA